MDVEPGKRDVDEVDAEAEPTEGRKKGRTEEAHKVVVAEGGAGVGGGAVEQPGGDEDEGEVEGDHEQGHVPGVVVVQLEQGFVVGGLVEPGKEQRDDGEDEEADVPAVADDGLQKGERELEHGIRIGKWLNETNLRDLQVALLGNEDAQEDADKVRLQVIVRGRPVDKETSVGDSAR